MRVVTLVAALTITMSCNGKSRGGESPVGPPTPPPQPPAPVATGSATDVTPPPTPPSPPAGSEAVVAVPPEIASKVRLVEVARDLKRPVAFVVAPGDQRRRWFVVEQFKARIWIYDNGTRLKTPFFDFGGKVSTSNEQGLLGLAFHPQFATNRKLYVHYTDRDDHSHVVEYTASASNADAVDMASAREVFFHEQPYSNHNGGHLLFGPDGKLWIGMGDGGAAGDPLRAGQDMKQLLAKMLRLDVDKPGAKPEIAHLGVRNPWRYAFDPKTGDLFIGDVGQNKWEYVFVVAGGDTRRHNFGWNITEGRHCYTKRTCDRSGFTEPVVDYSHDEGCSLTGGVVYRGKAIPALDGAYFYADYCTSLLRSFRFHADASDPAGGVARDHWNWRAALDPGGKLNNVSSFGVDADGEIYIVTLVGSIYKLVPAT